MSCFRPMAGEPYADPTTGLLRYRVIGKYHPSQNIEGNDGIIPIPCGKCLGCKLDYSRKWADRLILELDHTGKGIFLTLTYNDKNVPRAWSNIDGMEICSGQTLDKRDFQLFMKRLRKHFDDREIRFYACGEYGSKTERPHYHAIIFGLCLDDFFDLFPVGVNDLGQEYFTSGVMASIWSLGYVCLSEVSYKTCAYCTRYVMKKAFASAHNFEYLPEEERCNFVPEFSLMSRNPGIASFWYDDHPDQEDLSRFFVSDPSGSLDVNVPSYVLSKLRDRNPDAYDRIIQERKDAAFDSDFMKTYGTELSYFEYNEMLYDDLVDRTVMLTKLRK